MQAKKQRKIDFAEDTKVAAWLHSQAIGNVLNGCFGGKSLSFDELFGNKPKREKITHAELKAELRKHNMILE